MSVKGLGYRFPNCVVCGKKLYRYNTTGYCQSCWLIHLNKERMGENHHAWTGDNVGYLGMHDRIYHRRGKASGYKCVDCGKQAEDWSLVKGYHPNDAENYDPRCTKCHTEYDGPRERDDKGRFA